VHVLVHISDISVVVFQFQSKFCTASFFSVTIKFQLCYFSYCGDFPVPVSAVYVRNTMFDSQIQSVVKLVVHF